MEKGANKRLGRRLERFDARMNHIGGFIVLQHVVEIVKALHDSPLVLIVSELSRVYPFIVLI